MEENNKVIRKKIFENLLIAIAVLLYLIVVDFAYIRVEKEILEIGVKVASLITLFLSIAIFEIAYHKDSGKLAINGMEVLILAFYTLTVFYIVNRMQIEFATYITFSAYVFVIYYILKCILIYTKERKKYLQSLSDIHEIVSKEPVKKEARRKEDKK